MPDTSVTKVDAAHAPNGPHGQRYVANGRARSMRLWDLEPPGDGGTVRREYETVGHVIAGRAELTLEGQTVTFQPGKSWIVPKGAGHRDRIQKTFTIQVT